MTIRGTVEKGGSLLIWLDKEMTWLTQPDGSPGRTAVFSDAAMQFCLTIKVLFKLTLGAYPELSLKKARDVVGTVPTKLDAGVSVLEIKAWLEQGSDAVRSSRPKMSQLEAAPSRSLMPTFREIAKTWFGWKVSGLSNGKHIQQSWNTVETYVFPILGHLPVADIKPAHVQDAIRPIWHSKHETARRTLAREVEIFEVAIDQHHCDQNVAALKSDVSFGGVNVIQGHFGSLDYEKIHDFWMGLTTVNCHEHTRQMAMLMVLTPKRTRECRFAEWGFFDKKKQFGKRLAHP